MRPVLDHRATAAAVAPRPRRARRRARVSSVLGLIVLGGLGLVVGLGAVPAYAHNALTSVSPADGSTVRQAPAEIVLTFDQPVLGVGAAVIVTDATGTEVQEGRPRLVDNTVTQLVESAAPAGNYRVQWRVTSADGHPIDGVTTFTATAPGAVRTTSAEPSDVATDEPTPGEGDSAPSGPSYAWLVLVVVVAGLIAGFVVIRRRTDRTLEQLDVGEWDSDLPDSDLPDSDPHDLEPDARGPHAQKPHALKPDALKPTVPESPADDPRRPPTP